MERRRGQPCLEVLEEELQCVSDVLLGEVWPPLGRKLRVFGDVDEALVLNWAIPLLVLGDVLGL